MGFEQNKGTFLNAENTTDTQGLLSAGVSVPLLKGLLVDERRNMLKQAQFFQQINEAEKVKLINKILFQASKDYWEWYFAYRELLFLQTGLELAQTRYEAVKKRVTNGELAGIDSVQAKIILQERQIQLQQARLEIQNDRLIVANHLWGENNTPRLLDENTIPQAFLMQPFQLADLENIKTYAQNYHPELQKLKFKGFQLGAEARYQRNTLLPKLDVQYHLLGNLNPTTETTGWNAQRNYKLGLNFEFPLFLRKERGKFQQTRIKQNQNELELTQMQREIQTQIQNAYNELKTLEEQMKVQEVMVQNYQILRNGEYARFLNGESSLFLINTQESKLIESQIKYEAQKSKYGKARAMLIWVSGGQTWD
jgi:outer membrane protein TolC